MEYKRLTRKDERGFYHYNCTEKDQEDCMIYENCGECYGTSVLYRLAELEDKIEQGKMIEAPNPKYVIAESKITGGKFVSKLLPKALYSEEQNAWIFWYDTFAFSTIIYEFDTKEEAEKKLKELQNG